MKVIDRRSILGSLLGISAVGTAHSLSLSGKVVSSLLDSAQVAAPDTTGIRSGMRRVAVEEHFTTEALMTYLSSRIEAGATYDLPLPYRVSAHTASLISEKRLKDMDEGGISMQVLSPVCFYDGLDAVEGAAMARKTNDETAKIVKQYPKRYAGFAGLACLVPDAAAKELERAVTELGLKGAIIYSNVRGEYLDDQKYWGIFATAEKLGVPIFLHPKEPSAGMIKPYETYPALEGPMLGYGAEAALHAMRLVCSGLFDQYPNLKIILGHGGEGIPFWLWRMDKGGMRPMSAGGSAPAATNGMRCKKTPSTYIKENFFVNTSGMPWPPVLQFLHSALGADKILFAVDYPAESNTLEVQAIEALKISSSDKEKIFHGNAEKLLGV